MAPKAPNLPTPAPLHSAWDRYVTEAMANVKPFRLPLPPTPDDPEPGDVEVPCPLGTQMDAMTAAQRTGDDAAAFVALFGEDLAPRLLTATAGLPFIVRARLIGDVMKHYGLQAAGGNLGD